MWATTTPNSSSSPSVPPPPSPSPLEGNAAAGAFLSGMIALAAGGNSLVCVAIYKDRSLRRIGNLFVASLAVADLFVASFVMPFALANDVLGHWPFGVHFCDTWIAFDVMGSTASILHLSAISLDRYVHIQDPLRYGQWMKRGTVSAAIVTMWLVSALVSFLPISLGLHRPHKPSSDPVSSTQCALDLTPLYAVVSSCISFYVPCIVMIVLYGQLYLSARRHVRHIRAVNVPMSTSSSSPPPCSVSEHKAAVTLGIIVGVFLVCWVPFFCVNILVAFCKDCVSLALFQSLTWLGYCNSALNPLIYSAFNQEFRDAFRRVLFGQRRSHHVDCDDRACTFCCCCCCCYHNNSPSSSSSCPCRSTDNVNQSAPSSSAHVPLRLVKYSSTSILQDSSL